MLDDPKAQRDVVVHVVLVTLTRFIPLPLVDDHARQALLRRMTRGIATSHQRELSDAQQHSLTDDPPSGCCSGCLFQIFTWPFRKILPKITVVFEVKKLADLASLTYVQAFLLDSVYQKELWTDAESVRRAIDAVTLKVGTSPVEHAFRLSLEGVYKLLDSTRKTIFQRIRKLLPGEKDQEGKVTQLLEEAKDSRLTDALLQGAQSIPREYLEQLTSELVRELTPEVPGSRQGA